MIKIMYKMAANHSKLLFNKLSKQSIKRKIINIKIKTKINTSCTRFGEKKLELSKEF